jgi:CubicO group peptidase (beta-lactamase class C family)
MKIAVKAFACVGVLASLTGCAGSASALEPARVLEGMIRTAMRRHGIVGMSAVVVSGDRRLLKAGYGFADRSRRIPVTPETLFPLASVTKLFTATAVMQLVEQGRIDLDAPVSRYLPEMAQPGTMALGPTVRQLLTHHSGLPGNIMEGFELLKPDPTGFLEVPRLLGGSPPACTPDTVFAYCNSGYSLLGCLVERVSGTGYADFVARAILGPLGMSRTRFFLSPADAEGTAMGYDGRRQVPVYPMRDIPAGALMSTGEDMEKFMGFVFDRGRDGVLGRAAFAEMTSRQNEGVILDGDFSIGLGYWLIRPVPADDEFASHAGDQPPFHTVLVTIPKKRIGVFLGVNSSRDPSALIPLAVELVRAVYSWQTGKPVMDQPLPRRVPLDRAALARLAGRYASPMGLIEVQPRGGKLLTRALGLPLELVPRADGSFTAELSLLGVLALPLRPLQPLRFTPIETGGLAYLRISAMGILAGVAERMEPGEVPAAWVARAGSYRIVQRGENTNYRWPRTISLRFDRRSGLLLFSYAFPGVRASFPLLTPNDGEAVIAGKGTGLGDTIAAREEGGEVFLEWSGLLLKRE